MKIMPRYPERLSPVTDRIVQHIPRELPDARTVCCVRVRASKYKGVPADVKTVKDTDRYLLTEIDVILYKRWLDLRSSKSLICERWLNPLAFINDVKLLPNFTYLLKGYSVSLSSNFYGVNHAGDSSYNEYVDNPLAPDTAVWVLKEDIKKYSNTTLVCEGQQILLCSSKDRLASAVGVSDSTAARLLRDGGDAKMRIFKTNRWALRWLPTDIHLFDLSAEEIIPMQLLGGGRDYDEAGVLILHAARNPNFLRLVI